MKAVGWVEQEVGWVTAEMAAVAIPPPSSVRQRPIDPTLNSRGPPHGAAPGFTLVELLTVVAILGILGTLLLTTLSAASRKSRLVRCTSNLHQLSLALNMYLGDFEQRPTDYRPVVRLGYIAAREILVCPQDVTRNWAGLVGNNSLEHVVVLDPGSERAADGSTAPAFSPEEPLPFSYFSPLSWNDEQWRRLLRPGNMAGLAACQVHGLGKPDLAAPSLHNFQGLILRAQQDGAVVRRKLFWTDSPATAPPPAADPSSGLIFMGDSTVTLGGVGTPEWPLLTDDPAP